MLSLGELGCATGAFATVLLSFLHTRITGEQACFLEGGAESLVILEQSSGNTVTDRTCLAGNAAAVYAANDVEFLSCAGDLERLTNDELKSFKTEIIVDISVVDGNLTCTCINADAGYRALSASCTVEIRIGIVH